MLKINRKEKIKNIALSQLPSLLKTIFPSGSIKGHEFLIGDIQGNTGNSMRVELQGDKAGLWNDFASENSGDIFDLLATHFRLDTNSHFNELLDKAESLLSIDNSKPVITGT